MSQLPEFIKNSIQPLKDYSEIKSYTLKIQPQGNTSFSPSGTREIKFLLPKSGILLGEKSRFYLRVKVDGDSASDDKLMSNIHSIFEERRIRVGSTDLIQENEYGFFKTLQHDALMSDTDLNNMNTSIMNIPNNIASGTFKKYSIPLASKFTPNDFFSDLLPLYKMETIELEYVLNSSLAKFTTATTAVQTLDVQNCELELHIIDSENLRKILNNVDITRSISTHFHYRNVLPSGASSASVNVPANYRNIRSVLMVPRLSADVIDPNWETGNTALETYKYSHAVALSGLSKYHLVIDGEQVPKQEIDTTNNVELIENLTKAWNLNRLGGWFDSSDTYTTSDGKIYISVPLSVLSDGVNGLNTRNKSNNIIWNGTFSSATGSQLDQDFFILYDKFISINKQGLLTVVK